MNEKSRLNIPFIKKISVLMLGTFLLFSSCTKNISTSTMYTSSQVPYVAVSVSININNSLYSGLSTVGGVVYLANVGYRGILVYRYSSSVIIAMDRTCTYDISDAGGIVYSENNGTAVCPDCGSVYNLNNGGVNTGPATIGLKEYNVLFNQSTGALSITN